MLPNATEVEIKSEAGWGGAQADWNGGRRGVPHDRGLCVKVSLCFRVLAVYTISLDQAACSQSGSGW